MNAKKLIALLLLLAAILSLIGCTGKQTDGDAPAAAPAAGDAEVAAQAGASGEASAEAEPSAIQKAAQEAAAAYEADPDAKILHAGTTVAGGGFHCTNHGDTLANYVIYESLVLMDNGTLSLLLAESIDWPDKLTCEVKIRDDVTFVNGEKCTGEDVLYSFEKMSSSFMSDNFRCIDFENSYVKDDGQTVVFKLLFEYGPFENYALEMPSIVDKSVVESWSDNDARWWDQPVGSGPYVIAENISGSHLTLVRRADYWDKDNMPEWDEIVINYYSDRTAMFVAFENHEIDIVLDMASTDYDRVVEGNVKDAETVAYGTVGYNANYMLAFGSAREEFADVKVREAIANAVNREAVGEVCFGGLYSIPDSVLAPKTMYYTPVGNYDKGMDYSKQCMAESAYPDGFHIEVVTTPAESLIWEVIEGSLSELGITVTVDTYDMLTCIGLYMNGASDMMLVAAAGGNKFCEPYVDLSASCDDGGLPVCRIYDEEYNELFDKALFTTDSEQRAAYYAEVQQWLYDTFNFVPVVEPSYSYAYRTDVIREVAIDSVTNPNLCGIHAK